MRNYKLFTYICGILFLQGTLSSCEKLLEVEAPANQITAVQAFESVQTANAALSGLYAGLYDNSPLSGDRTGSYIGLYTDELDMYSNNLASLEIYENTLIESNTIVSAFWTNAYQKIYMANAILEGVERAMNLSETDRQRIKGEALLIRSMLFFYLQQLYGDIPYIRTSSYITNQSMTKTSAPDVLQQIASDLTDAVSLLSDQYRNTERVFPNRKVAQLCLAKIYMLQHKWKEAEALLDGIRTNPLYQFQHDLTKVFDKSGQHILWQLKPRNNGDAVKEISTYYFANSAPLTMALSRHLMLDFPNTDLRRQHWIAAVTVGINTWYRPNKYKNLSNNNTEYSIVFRLEEVYLLLAEVLANQDRIPEAVNLVNAIRQRANIPLLSDGISRDQLLEEILLEERREFFTETGHRFLDLKRQGKLDKLAASKPNWKAFHKLWPIPQNEISLNPNLKPQNTGY